MGSLEARAGCDGSMRRSPGAPLSQGIQGLGIRSIRIAGAVGCQQVCAGAVQGLGFYDLRVGSGSGACGPGSGRGPGAGSGFGTGGCGDVGSGDPGAGPGDDGSGEPGSCGPGSVGNGSGSGSGGIVNGPPKLRLWQFQTTSRCVRITGPGRHAGLSFAPDAPASSTPLARVAFIGCVLRSRWCRSSFSSVGHPGTGGGGYAVTPFRHEDMTGMANLRYPSTQGSRIPCRGCK